MKFKCPCNHIVIDRDSSLPNKGEIIRDQTFESFYEKSATLAGEFIEAINEGTRQNWIKSFYGRDDMDVSNTEVIFDIYCRASVKNGLCILQCESCGRIFIQKNIKSSSYICFKPEDEDWQGILEV